MKGVLIILVMAAAGGAAAYYYDDSLRARIDAMFAQAVQHSPVAEVSAESAAEPGMPIAAIALVNARAAGKTIKRAAWKKMISAAAADKFAGMSGDGELTIHESLRAEEKVQPPMWLRRTDTNTDGGVDLAEMNSAPQFFAQADADGSGKVSAAEWWDLYSRFEWQWFQKSDTDKSETLNLQEYLRGKKLSQIAKTVWEKADSDRNGVLTAAEADAILAAESGL
ncbi:MAG: hypothetical protein ACR2QC_06705 [Gammaproteobacteria bacterium]